MSPPVPGVRRNAEGRTRRIAVTWVGDKHPEQHHAQPQQANQQWPPDRSPPGAPDAPQPSRKGKQQEAKDEKVRDLFPSLISQ